MLVADKYCEEENNGLQRNIEYSMVSTDLFLSYSFFCHSVIMFSFNVFMIFIDLFLSIR